MASTNSNAQALNSDYLIFDLDESWLDAVVSLEQVCSLNPWSRGVLKRELERGFSLRPGVVFNDELIAQSFSYLVVDELHILNLAVHPNHREQGIGKMLLAHVLDSATNRGAKVATLEVRESNIVAQKLYAGFGFQQSGVRKSYYQNNGEDALVLEKSLSKNYQTFIPKKSAQKNAKSL